MNSFGFDDINESTERRIKNVDGNTPGLGLVRVNLPELEEFDVITFSYKAESPGFPKKGIQPPNPNLYDANPLIVLTEVKMVNGKRIIYGMNANYLMNRIARGKLILANRREKYVSKSLYERMIHAYRLDRIKSNLYRPRNVVLDKDLLTSLGNWKQVEKRPKPPSK